MLMFDNILFATFIPQILMLAGYIFCLLAPRLNASSATTLPENTSPQNIVYHSDSDQKIQNNCFSVNFQKTEIEDVQENPQLKISLFKSRNKICIPHSFSLISEEFSFKLFCRPPPVC